MVGLHGHVGHAHLVQLGLAGIHCQRGGDEAALGCDFGVGHAHLAWHEQVVHSQPLVVGAADDQVLAFARHRGQGIGHVHLARGRGLAGGEVEHIGCILHRHQGLGHLGAGGLGSRIVVEVVAVVELGKRAVDGHRLVAGRCAHGHFLLHAIEGVVVVDIGGGLRVVDVHLRAVFAQRVALGIGRLCPEREVIFHAFHQFEGHGGLQAAEGGRLLLHLFPAFVGKGSEVDGLGAVGDGTRVVAILQVYGEGHGVVALRCGLIARAGGCAEQQCCQSTEKQKLFHVAFFFINTIFNHLI